MGSNGLAEPAQGLLSCKTLPYSYYMNRSIGPTRSKPLVSEPLPSVGVVVDVVVHAVAVPLVIGPLPWKGRHKSSPGKKGAPPAPPSPPSLTSLGPSPPGQMTRSVEPAKGGWVGGPPGTGLGRCMCGGPSRLSCEHQESAGRPHGKGSNQACLPRGRGPNTTLLQLVCVW